MRDLADHPRELIARGHAFIVARQQLVESFEALPSVIMSLIAMGIDTRDDIVRTVPKLLSRRYAHVAHELDEGTGDDPAQAYWYRDAAKRYRLHDHEGIISQEDNDLAERLRPMPRVRKRKPLPLHDDELF